MTQKEKVKEVIETKPVASETDNENKLVSYIQAGYPVLWINTAEESRAEVMVYEAVKKLSVGKSSQRGLKVWSCTEGLGNAFNPQEKPQELQDAVAVLEHISKMPNQNVFILRDFHSYLSNGQQINPMAVRMVRDIARDFKQHAKTLIIISPIYQIPKELEKDVTLIEFELPKYKDLEKVYNILIATNADKLKDNGIIVDADEKEKIIQSTLGLTVIEAENAIAKALIDQKTNREKSISKCVMSEKALIVKKTGILEYFEPKQTINDIGGLENLKLWLKMRSNAFSKDARIYGLPMPRGIMLCGLPGTGKSLSAKVASTILQVPLLRFDIGKCFGSLVGQSEENMRTAIQTAEAIGNAVLWIDEMEKAFAGMGSAQSGDSGTSQRVFGNFITWMQEKTKPIFIIATVNRIEGLPPEILRKGRFDEIFYVDLPNEEEREEILKIHIRKYGRNPNDFKDLSACVKASEDFSGAELEEAVISGLYSAFSENKRELNAKDILKALQSTNPLSQSKSDELHKMIDWATENAMNASRIINNEKTKTPKKGRQLDFEVTK